MLSIQQITKFQELYEKHFDKEIDRDEICEKGVKLIRLMELIYKPMTKNEYELIQKRREKTNNIIN